MEEITLAHQTLLEPLLRALNSDLIDYSFTNVYLFRKIHQFQLVQKKGLFIRGKSRDGVSYLMPTFPLRELDFSDIEGEILFPIPEAWLSFFDSRFEWSHLDADDDYLYKSAKMAHLPGRKLSSRRNLVHQFLDHYPDHEVQPLTQDRAGDALQVLEGWKSHPHHDPRYTDYEECKEALQLIDRLHLGDVFSMWRKNRPDFYLGRGSTGALMSTTWPRRSPLIRGFISFSLNFVHRGWRPLTNGSIWGRTSAPRTFAIRSAPISQINY